MISSLQCAMLKRKCRLSLSEEEKIARTNLERFGFLSQLKSFWNQVRQQIKVQVRAWRRKGKKSVGVGAFIEKRPCPGSCPNLQSRRILLD